MMQWGDEFNAAAQRLFMVFKHASHLFATDQSAYLSKTKRVLLLSSQFWPIGWKSREGRSTMAFRMLKISREIAPYVLTCPS